MKRLEHLNKVLSLEKEEIILKYLPEREKFYKEYLHSQDTRKPQEVIATVSKIKKATQTNLKRLEKSMNKPVEYNQQKYKNCIFICVHGIPPYPDEFDFLNLPGQCFFVASNGFQLDKDEDYIEKHLVECRFQRNALKINKIVQQNPTKDIVFVLHSFGTYNLAVYFEKYGAQRVKGIIELGPASIRHYRYALQVMHFLDSISEKEVLENKDKKVTNQFQAIIDKINSEENLGWVNFPSLAYTLAFLSYFKSDSAKTIFELNRKFPKVLKFIAFGEEEQVFYS